MADLQSTFEYRLRNAVKAAKAGQLTDEDKTLLKRVIRAWGTEKARNPSAQPNTTDCYTPIGAASCEAVLASIEASYKSVGWYDKFISGKSSAQKVIAGTVAVGVAGLVIYGIDRAAEQVMWSRKFRIPKLYVRK